MAKGCKKCDPHDICEECPEWIFTLADLIMCMMGLFVILWVLKPGMTTPPAAGAAGQQSAMSDEFLEMLGGVREGFGWEATPESSDPVAQAVIRKRRREQSGEGQGGETREKRESQEGTDALNTSIRDGKYSVVGGRLLFEAGGTRFTQETVRALNDIVKLIRGHRNIVLVKGHTSLDDLPEDASAEERMKLSLQRAQSVADYLTQQGVEPEILRVQGCSTFEPVKQRAYTVDALQMNRRVEVISTANLVEDLQDNSQKSGAASEPAPKAAPAHH